MASPPAVTVLFRPARHAASSSTPRRTTSVGAPRSRHRRVDALRAEPVHEQVRREVAATPVMASTTRSRSVTTLALALVERAPPSRRPDPSTYDDPSASDRNALLDDERVVEAELARRPRLSLELDEHGDLHRRRRVDHPVGRLIAQTSPGRPVDVGTATTRDRHVHRTRRSAARTARSEGVHADDGTVPSLGEPVRCQDGDPSEFGDAVVGCADQPDADPRGRLRASRSTG